MIRIIVDWILYFLHIKEGDKRPALIQLMDLMLVIFVAVTLIGVINSLPSPKINWRKRILSELRFAIWRWRRVIIGY